MECSDLLAVVSLTHNHPQTIKDVIQRSADYYKAAGIDYYFFDSSDDDDTRNIVNEYVAKGYDNLIYVSTRVNSAYEKMQMIFSGQGLKKRYKYIWPTKDRAYVKDWVLDKIIEAAQKEYDLIFTISNTIDNGEEYDNAVDFYRDYGGWVTSINLTIYNTETVLLGNHIAEEEYYSKGAEAFLQNAAVFYGLSKIEAPRIKIIDTSADGICMSPYSKTMSEHSIEVWKDHWIRVNDYLPDIYNEYKAKVIKETASFPWILGDVDILIDLKNKGEINEDNLEWVLKDWERISDISKESIKAIVANDYDPEHDLSIANSNDEMIKLLIRLNEILKYRTESSVEIPCNSIFKYLVDMLNRAQYVNINRKRIILGSLKDILTDLSQTNDIEKMQMHIQEIVSYMLLLELMGGC